MSKKSNSFIETLDHLVDLLEQLKEKVIRETVNHPDNAVSKNLDAIIQNYHVIRNDYPAEVSNQFSESLKRLVFQLIDQVNSELETRNGTNMKVNDDLRRIDQLLQSEDLSVEEIDRLLDKRSELSTGKPVNPLQ